MQLTRHETRTPAPIAGVSEHTLRELRSCLEAAFGPRLEDVFVFGSRVRGDAHAGSDLDIMITLKGAVQLMHDLHTAISSTYGIQLNLDIQLSIVVVPSADYAAGRFELHRVVRREGRSI